jgi:hypothetical protein
VTVASPAKPVAGVNRTVRPPSTVAVPLVELWTVTVRPSPMGSMSLAVTSRSRTFSWKVSPASSTAAGGWPSWASTRTEMRPSTGVVPSVTWTTSAAVAPRASSRAVTRRTEPSSVAWTSSVVPWSDENDIVSSALRSVTSVARSRVRDPPAGSSTLVSANSGGKSWPATRTMTPP